MAEFIIYKEIDKNAFLKRYKGCAEVAALIAIFQAQITNATTLSLTRKNVRDLSPLKDLRNLQTFCVGYTQVSDLSLLKDLQNLQNLSVSSTQIRDLSPLKDLQNLQILSIYQTQVSDTRSNASKMSDLLLYGKTIRSNIFKCT